MSIAIGFVGMKMRGSNLAPGWQRAISHRWATTLGEIYPDDALVLSEDRLLYFQFPQHKVLINLPLALSLAFEVGEEELNPRGAHLFAAKEVEEALVFYWMQNVAGWGLMVVKDGQKLLAGSDLDGLIPYANTVHLFPEWFKMPKDHPDWKYFEELATRFLGQPMKTALQNIDSAQLFIV